MFIWKNVWLPQRQHAQSGWRTAQRQPAAPVDAILLAEISGEPMVASHSVRKLDCEIEVVGNGLEAVAAWQRGAHRHDFHGLPDAGMDGFEATGKSAPWKMSLARAHPYHPMTAAAMQGDP